MTRAFQWFSVILRVKSKLRGMAHTGLFSLASDPAPARPCQLGNLLYPDCTLPLLPSVPLLIQYCPQNISQPPWTQILFLNLFKQVIFTQCLYVMSTDWPSGAQSSEFLWLIFFFFSSQLNAIFCDSLQPGSGTPLCSHRPLAPCITALSTENCFICPPQSCEDHERGYGPVCCD